MIEKNESFSCKNETDYQRTTCSLECSVIHLVCKQKVWRGHRIICCKIGGPFVSKVNCFRSKRNYSFFGKEVFGTKLKKRCQLPASSLWLSRQWCSFGAASLLSSSVIALTFHSYTQVGVGSRNGKISQIGKYVNFCYLA